MKKRFNGLHPLNAYIPQMTRPVYKRRGFYACDIVHDWPAIVGHQWAEMTSPDRLVFRPGCRHEGTLYLRVYGAAALMIQHIQGEILERANTYFGYQAIATIRLLQAGLRPVSLTIARPCVDHIAVPEVQMCQDGALKDALTRLGQHIKAEKGAKDTPSPS